MAEAVREQHAIEVVAFVLHHPRMKAFHAFIHRLPVPIESLHAQSQPTGHLPPQPRHTEATFPAFVALRPQRGKHWIDQHGARDRWGFGVARIRTAAAEQHHPQRYTDLGSRQASAAASRHRVVQIRDQPGQLSIAQIPHRPGRLAQLWITQP